MPPWRRGIEKKGYNFEKSLLVPFVYNANWESGQRYMVVNAQK